MAVSRIPQNARILYGLMTIKTMKDYKIYFTILQEYCYFTGTGAAEALMDMKSKDGIVLFHIC